MPSLPSEAAAWGFEFGVYAHPAIEAAASAFVCAALFPETEEAPFVAAHLRLSDFKAQQRSPDLKNAAQRLVFVSSRIRASLVRLAAALDSGAR